MSKKKLISIELKLTSDKTISTTTSSNVMPKYLTIEWRRKGNQIILHKFIENLDYEYNYDELPKGLKMEICLFFSRRFLN
jgi:hypothetical protein